MDNFQFKRGSTSANATFVGPSGSISIDQEEGAIVIHDGVTPGGVFRLKAAQVLDKAALEFESNKAGYTASVGQQSFAPLEVDLTNPENVRVKVNDETMGRSVWQIVNNTVIFNVPMIGGETITFSNVETLESMLKGGADETGIETVIASAIEAATGATGVTLGSLVTNETLESAIEQIDITSAVNSAINNADGLGGTSLNDILTTGDSIDLGLVN